MSELIQKNDNRATIRWKLLTGASALALAAYVSGASGAKAEDATHPPIWIELDGQFAMQKNDLEIYSPPFLSVSPFDAISNLAYQKTRPYIWDKSGKISFQPEGSDWILSASIRFGKSGRAEESSFITPNPDNVFYGNEKVYRAYQDTQFHSSESHTIIDFKVGREVGLGILDRYGSSTLNLGVRFAQFHSSNHAGIQSQPTNCASDCPYNRFYGSFDGKRRFQGLGPSLSWDASAMIAGNPDDGGISLDWGVNGALLFGRQRMSEQHQTKKIHWLHGQHFTTAYHFAPSPVSRSRNVTVPNLGGFAAVSWRYDDAKVSFGYRADYFFNVLDGGIGAAQKEDRAFYGPYLGISVGLGG